MKMNVTRVRQNGRLRAFGDKKKWITTKRHVFAGRNQWLKAVETGF